MQIGFSISPEFVLGSSVKEDECKLFALNNNSTVYFCNG